MYNKLKIYIVILVVLINNWVLSQQYSDVRINLELNEIAEIFSCLEEDSVEYSIKIIIKDTLLSNFNN